MTLQKKDFIEIEFTGKTKDGTVFDSNIKSELEKLNSQAPAKPFIYSLGQGMFIEHIDEFLVGKKPGSYEIELTPEKSFGVRDSSKVRVVAKKVFDAAKLNPFPGATFNFDNQIGKVLSVSGGRITVDFNHPLAGKDVIYNLKVLKKIEDISEKTKAFIDFLFRKDLKFKIENKKLILEADKQMKQFAELFKDKFKEVLDLDLDVKEIEGNKE